MPTVTFLPSGKTLEASAGTDLLEASRQADVVLDAQCGGDGTCGKCVVKIIRGEIDSEHTSLLSSEAQGHILACRSKLRNSSVTVELASHPLQSEDTSSQATEEDDLFSRDLLPEQIKPNPVTRNFTIQVPPAGLEDGMSDLDRLRKQVDKELNKGQEIAVPLSTLRTLAQTLREQDGLVTLTLLQTADRLILTNIEAGRSEHTEIGVAIDLGTTTVAVQIVNLQTGKILSTWSDYNSQFACGLDVISRINYAQRPGGLAELSGRILSTINRLIEKAADSIPLEVEGISSAFISGNTTMTHLLLELEPEQIRLAPYTPTILKAPPLAAEEIGIKVNPQAGVFISPCLGSYVGGDITAGVLCTDLAGDNEEINLFIDIGTNGELVLGNRDFLTTCACSAGPAFEGGGIAEGMRAIPGAINRVEIDQESGKARYWTIGGLAPKGICGSGMITLLANLFRTSWIDAAGKLDRSRCCESIIPVGRRSSYLLVPADQSATGNSIAVSETDFESLIRAKAAVYSACSLMLEQIGIGFEDLSKVYIAGAFGRFLDLENAIIIGLIPDLPKEKFCYLGNASLAGTYLALVSREYRQKQMELAERMTYLELNTDPRYMDQYTAALFLPHTELSRFPRVRSMLR